MESNASDTRAVVGMLGGGPAGRESGHALAAGPTSPDAVPVAAGGDELAEPRVRDATLKSDTFQNSSSPPAPKLSARNGCRERRAEGLLVGTDPVGRDLVLDIALSRADACAVCLR